MSRIIAIALLGMLLVTGWRVYTVRARLGRQDADPAQLERVRAGLQLPVDIGGGTYRGEKYAIDEKVIRAAGADVYGSVQYYDDAGRPYRVYIGGSIGNQESFHAPNYCLPAAGWEVQADDVVPLVGGGGAAEISDATMRRLTLQQGREKMIVYYWFQAGDRIANHEWVVRYYRFLDLLADKPFQPTMIISVYVPVSDTFEQAEGRATEFLRTMGPYIDRALAPGEPSE